MRFEYAGELYAIYAPIEEAESGTVWFGESFYAIQSSRMVYEKGKAFKAHKHILNPRIIKRTQEAFVVFKGKLGIEIFNEDKELLGSFEAKSGDLVLLYKGYHAVKVVEDCIAYEVKSGSYDGYLSEEKEFFDVRKK